MLYQIIIINYNKDKSIVTLHQNYPHKTKKIENNKIICGNECLKKRMFEV